MAALEFDCGDCGRHIVFIIGELAPMPRLCAECIALPGWCNDPKLRGMLDPNLRKIVTDNVRPPIPVTTHDWCAYYDGDEERQQYGWGPTETEAVADLRANYPESEA